MKYKIKYRNSTGRIIEEYFEYNNVNVLKLALQDRGIRPETVEEVIESDSQLVERQPLSHTHFQWLKIGTGVLMLLLAAWGGYCMRNSDKSPNVSLIQRKNSRPSAGTANRGKRNTLNQVVGSETNAVCSSVSQRVNVVAVPKRSGRHPLHRWSFNGNLLDSVAGVTAVNCGLCPCEWSEDGVAVVLAGGEYGSSGLNLGEGMIPDGGRPFTIEIWARQLAVQHWSRIFEVGTSYMNMLNMCWTRGGDINSDSVQLYRGFPSTIFFRDDELAPYELGVEYHISLVVTPLQGGYTRFSYAKRDAQSGKVIRNGYVDVAPTWSLKDLPKGNFYLGHHNAHPNRTCDASAEYDEVRIWGEAFSESLLSESARRGPDVLPD